MLERLLRKLVRLFYTEYSEHSVRLFWNMVILLSFSVIYWFVGVNFILTVVIQTLILLLITFNLRRIIYMPVEDDADLYKVNPKKESRKISVFFIDAICFAVAVMIFVIPHVFFGLKFEPCFLALYIPEAIFWLAFIIMVHMDIEE